MEIFIENKWKALKPRTSQAIYTDSLEFVTSSLYKMEACEMKKDACLFVLMKNRDACYTYF